MMKKFMLSVLWFLLPIIILNLFTFKFYNNPEGGDLLRLGYIIDLYPNYRDIFSKEFENKIYYTQISEKPKTTKFEVLTIGDSFSEQDSFGYKNYLAKNKKILHIDRFLSDNQIQTLYSLLKGDFFEQYNFEYVILQNVERNFISNSKKFDANKVITCDKLYDLIDLDKVKDKVEFNRFKFPSNSIFKFPYFTYKYYSEKTFLFDQMVYKTEMSQNFFSVDNKELLFLKNDLAAIENNNTKENVEELNKILNDISNLLKKKGIKLIVLPAPDKYDVYYDFILDKTLFPKPLFFDHLKEMHKEYIYIDSKSVISSNLNRKKDLYFYDDTHWSPWTSKIIAEEIEKKMNSN